jgi:hypothetical protein
LKRFSIDPFERLGAIIGEQCREEIDEEPAVGWLLDASPEYGGDLRSEPREGRHQSALSVLKRRGLKAADTAQEIWDQGE